MNSIAIRRPHPHEIAVLPWIEDQADRRYARVGLQLVIDMPTASIASLQDGRRRHLLWVALSPLGHPTGFALMKLRGGTAWLDQLSVLDRWQRRGHGAALIERCARTARTLGFDTLYLSTYRDVAWNGPYYRRRGFEEVRRGAFSQPLRFALATGGHPIWRRAIMRRST